MQRATLRDESNQEEYRDDGCELAPSCLDCPLPACRYDLPPKRAGAILREIHVVVLLIGGLTADEVAVEMGISRRTVFRLKRSAASYVEPEPLRILAERSARRLEAWRALDGQGWGGIPP